MSDVRKCPHGIDVGPLDDFGVDPSSPVKSIYCNECAPRLVLMADGRWTHSVEWQYLTEEEKSFLKSGGVNSERDKQPVSEHKEPEPVSEDGPVLPERISFEVPCGVSADLQMMSIWKQAYKHFESQITPADRLNASVWFNNWVTAHAMSSALTYGRD